MKRLFQPLLSWLFAVRPKPSPTNPNLFPVFIDTETTGHLHVQLRRNIEGKARAQSEHQFTLNQLVEIKSLLPNQESTVFMTPVQFSLLSRYVDFYWVRAMDSDDEVAKWIYQVLRLELSSKILQWQLS